MQKSCWVLMALSAACGSKLADVGQADAGTWTNVTANLAGMQSGCGNLALVVSRPDKDRLIAGVVTRGLWVSADGATTWSALGQGSGSATIDNAATSIVFDPVNASTFWESGIYGSGVFRTDDDGVTFSRLGDVLHDDGVSVDLTDPARRTLLAGGHESGNRLSRSADGGGQWNDVGAGLPALSGNASFPLVIDSQTHLVGTWGATGAGVFRTVDGGATWSQVYGIGVGSRALVASDGAIYWLLESNQGMIRSADQGKTWTKITGGSVFAATSGGVKLIELPDGRLVSIGSPYLIISADHGTTWRYFGPVLPPGIAPDGIAYSSFRKAIYLWKNDCGQTVPQDAIVRFDFDYRAQ